MTITATAKPYAVYHWCSHPDSDNDDCQRGDDFDTLEQAEAAYAAPVAEYFVAFIELTGPDGLQRVRANPSYEPKRVARERALDEAAARHEGAMQAGMGLGIEAYNEAMGYD